jgi:hypothetical protein
MTIGVHRSGMLTGRFGPGPDIAGGSARSMLSLVFLLLGFFAVMNATAERHDARSDAVLASLAITFGPVLGDGAAAPYSSQTGDALALRAVEGEIREVFRAVAELTATNDGAGRIAEVRMPAAALFVGDSAVLRPGADQVLRDLAGALLRVEAGIAPTLTVTVGTLRVGGPFAAGAQRQALALAVGLIGHGLDPGLVAVGSARALGGAVAFTFGWRRATP